MGNVNADCGANIEMFDVGRLFVKQSACTQPVAR